MLLIILGPLCLWASAVVRLVRSTSMDVPSDLAVFGSGWYLPHHSRYLFGLVLALFVALAVIEVLLDLYHRRLARDPAWRDLMRARGEGLLKRVRGDLEPRLEPGEELTGFHWCSQVVFGPGTVATEVTIVAGGVALITSLAGLDAYYGVRAVVQTWLSFLVLMGGMLLHRTRSPFPAVWAIELAGLPLIISLINTRAAPPWLTPVVIALAVSLTIRETLRRGYGRVVVQTPRRTFDYQVPLRGAPVLAATGPLPADVGEGMLTYCPLVESASVPLGAERPDYLRPLVPFLMVGGVLFSTAFHFLDLGFSAGFNIVPTIEGWNAGYVEPMEFGCQLQLGMQPDDPVALSFLADVRCMQGRHAEAVVLLERARTSGLRPAGGSAGGLAAKLTSFVGDHAMVPALVRARFPVPTTPAERGAIELRIARELVESHDAHLLANGHGAREGLPHAREAVRLAPEDGAAHLVRAECAAYLWSLQHRMTDKRAHEYSVQIMPGPHPWEALRVEGRTALEAARPLLERGSATHLDPLINPGSDDPAAQLNRLTLAAPDRVKRVELWLALGPKDGPSLCEVVARTGVDWIAGPAVSWRTELVSRLQEAGCNDAAKKAFALLTREKALSTSTYDGLKTKLDSAK